MSEDEARAVRRRQVRLSPIWVVPLVALAIGAWMVYDTFTSRGPVITLEMPNAEGIEAGKTQIKTRNVQVGRVEDVRLSEDLSHTVVHARLRAGTERMLNPGTRFWVVKPRIGREGISGLGTVLSGAYIQLLPGEQPGDQRHFSVLEEPPVAPADARGVRVELVSAVSNSLSSGDPVTYHGITVGRVESVRFESAEQRVTHRVFIRSPYDTLVTDTTRFWTASGVNVSVNADGFSVDFESLETLLGGGLTFGVPEDLPEGQAVAAGTRFELYPDRASAREGSFDRFLEYVLLVEDTVRGLRAGAPVEYRGVRVGTVVAVPWHFRAPRAGELGSLAVPVLIRLEPRRLETQDARLSLTRWRERIDALVDQGLRATLSTGNLLTGAVFVDLNFQPEAAEVSGPARFEGKHVLPVASGAVNRIQEQVTSLLTKLNALEIEPVLAEFDESLQGSQQTFAAMQATADALRTVLDDSETRALPAELRTTLDELRTTLDGYSADSEAYQRLMSVLERLDAVMRDAQPVVRTLREQPNALIFDKREAADPQPRAPRR